MMLLVYLFGENQTLKIEKMLTKKPSEKVHEFVYVSGIKIGPRKVSWTYFRLLLAYRRSPALNPRRRLNYYAFYIPTYGLESTLLARCARKFAKNRVFVRSPATVESFAPSVCRKTWTRGLFDF